MPLSDFMPYGAPDLLEGARSRMAASTMLASLVVALSTATLGLLLTRGLNPSVVPASPSRSFDFEVPPSLDEWLRHAPPSTPAATIAVDPHALVRTVPTLPEPAAPVAELDRPVLPVGPAGGDEAGTVRPVVGTGPAGVTETADPAPDVFIVVDEYPNLVRCSEPRYPDLAREAGVEGTVRVLVLVGLDGRARRAIVAPGGSVPMLDEAALDAARTCVFTPALANGHPVKVWVSRSYRFRLH